jgi:hypothetical protein
VSEGPPLHITYESVVPLPNGDILLMSDYAQELVYNPDSTMSLRENPKNLPRSLILENQNILYDFHKNQFIPLPSFQNTDSFQTLSTTVLANGNVFILRLAKNQLSNHQQGVDYKIFLFDIKLQQFKPIGTFNLKAMGGIQSYLLSNQKILLLSIFGNAYTFDPNTNTFSQPIHSHYQFLYPQVLDLPNGNLFIIGEGLSSSLDGSNHFDLFRDYTKEIHSYAAIFNPKTNTFCPYDPHMVAPNQKLIAIKLQDGRVLLISGTGEHAAKIVTPECQSPDNSH